MHQIFPAAVEKMMAVVTHRNQIEKAPPALDTPGGLQEPTPVGTSVDAGWKESH